MAIKLNLIDPRTLESIAQRRFVWSVEIPNLPWRDSFTQYSQAEQSQIEQSIKGLFDQRARETLQAVNLIPPTAVTSPQQPMAQPKGF